MLVRCFFLCVCECVINKLYNVSEDEWMDWDDNTCVESPGPRPPLRLITVSFRNGSLASDPRMLPYDTSSQDLSIMSNYLCTAHQAGLCGELLLNPSWPTRRCQWSLDWRTHWRQRGNEWTGAGGNPAAAPAAAAAPLLCQNKNNGTTCPPAWQKHG